MLLVTQAEFFGAFAQSLRRASLEFSGADNFVYFILVQSSGAPPLLSAPLRKRKALLAPATQNVPNRIDVQVECSGYAFEWPECQSVIAKAPMAKAYHAMAQILHY
jgi:hypothetical protein